MQRARRTCAAQFRKKKNTKRKKKLEAKDVLPNINRTQTAERAKKCRFLFVRSWHSNSSERGTKHVFPVCEFGANPFSGSRDISYTNKKVTDSAKNRTLRSSLRAVNSMKPVHDVTSPANSVSNPVSINQRNQLIRTARLIERDKTQASWFRFLETCLIVIYSVSSMHMSAVIHS